ncbi:hypothetical protein RFI_28514 [Reticulomyxa filosa]|uniref:Uncharacterized protein n=1 Tax=Reticulomyxa filosa TaxID=46433 RepID=X6M606_RETFI|nr:hypothetical protein RFI_28514 [Reticulomyxa filosa]|eukprot:ETO08872.1 hypothetical protein RFI_28514 [Reticulomyxa filosa]
MNNGTFLWFFFKKREIFCKKKKKIDSKFLKKIFNPLPLLEARRCFSNVWGERTIKWIEQELSNHFQEHKANYDFTKIPFLVDDDTAARVLGRQRRGLVTPCVKLASSTWLIEELIRRGYHVTGLAMPEVKLEVFCLNDEMSIQLLFSLTELITYIRLRLTVKTEGQPDSDTIVLERENLYVEKKSMETFAPKKDGWQSFDVVFDERPLLTHCDPKLIPYDVIAKTTVFGHAIRKGGILYVQTEDAEHMDQKIKLANTMKACYPSDYFALVAERKLSWTRQYLYLKSKDTLKM